MILLNQNEKDKKIDQVLESIHKGYDKLERIEEDLAKVRENRDTIFKSNN